MNDLHIKKPKFFNIIKKTLTPHTSKSQIHTQKKHSHRRTEPVEKRRANQRHALGGLFT